MTRHVCHDDAASRAYHSVPVARQIGAASGGSTFDFQRSAPAARFHQGSSACRTMKRSEAAARNFHERPLVSSHACASEHVPHQALQLQASCAEDADMMAREEHATSRVGQSRSGHLLSCVRRRQQHHFQGARLRRGIVNPQVPVGCSGDVKQQRAQTIAIADHSERQPTCSVIAFALQ